MSSLRSVIRPRLLALTICLSCFAACTERGSVAQLPETTAGGPRPVRTAPISVVMDRDNIRATGTAAALSTTKVMPLVPGVIKQLPIKEGDVIKAGQVLAVVDQRQYRLALRQAQAAIEATAVASDATTREKLRFERLLKEDATAKARYDQVLDRYRGAQAQMKQALVALDMAKKAMTDTVLRAPYTGIVTNKVASVGDYATTMPPTVIVVLQQIDTLEIKISLPEPDLNRVEQGATALVRFPSLQRQVEAKVSRVIRTVNPMTRSFEVIVDINNKDNSIQPGIYARVQIATSKPRQRMLVPEQAVVDEGSDVFSIYVVQGDTARRHEVRAAAATEGQSEIISGLSGTETVIIDPTGLTDGDGIRIERGTAKATTATPTTAPTATPTTAERAR